MFSKVLKFFTFRSLLLLTYTLLISFFVRWFIVLYFNYDLSTLKDFFFTGIIVSFVLKFFINLSKFNLFELAFCESDSDSETDWDRVNVEIDKREGIKGKDRGKGKGVTCRVPIKYNAGE